MDIKTKAVSGVKWTSFSTIICSVLQLLQLFILAKLLTPRDFGLMAIIMIVMILIRTFSDLGISAALIHNQNTDIKQISTLFWLNILVGIVLFLIVYIISPLVASFYSEIILHDLLVILSFTLIISPVGSIFSTLLQRDLKFRPLAKIEIITTFLGVSTTIMFAAQGYGVWSIIYGQLINSAVRTVLFFIAGSKPYPVKFYFKIREVKSFLEFGSFQMGEKFVNFFSERIDQFLIGYLLGTTTLGYYSFAFNIVSQPVNIINPVFNKVAFPVFAKVQEDQLFLKKAFLKVLQVILFITAPVLLGLALTAPSFVYVLFGEKWSDSIILIQILSILSLFRSIGNPVGSLLLAKGRADLGFYWNVGLLLLSAPLIYIGASFGGVIGVSVSLVILQLILFFPNYIFLVKPFIGKCLNIYLDVLLKPVLFTLIMIVLVYVAGSLLLNLNRLPSLLFEIGLGICIYIGLLYTFKREYLFEIKNYLQGSKIKI